MATLFRLVAAFQPSNLKEVSFGLDFETNLAVADSELQAAVNAATAGWSGSPNLRRNFSSEVRMIRAVAQAYTAAANPGVPPPNFVRAPSGLAHVSNINIAGTHAGAATPPQVSVVVSFKSNISARTAQGRIYLPTPPNDKVQTTGQLDPTYQQQLIDDFDLWVGGIENAPVAPQTFTHIVFSGKLGTHQTVSDQLLHGRCDTQRKRLTRELGTFTT